MKHDRPRLIGVASWLVIIAMAVATLQWEVGAPLTTPPLTSVDDLARWVADRGPVVAAFACLRVVVLVVGWYVIVAGTLGATLRALQARRLVALTDRVTVGPLRRLLAGTFSLTLASTGLVTAGTTIFRAPVVLAVGVADSNGAFESEPSDAPGPPAAEVGEDVLTMRQLPEGEPAPTPVASSPETSRRWTVAPGECFWSIAESVLTEAWSHPPTDAEIVPYWQQLIEANRASLADPANPDLIYPGQEFTVPQPSAAPGQR